jgi:ligand-binding sensor domain-containing protein/signal transduction histidine kinase
MIRRRAPSDMLLRKYRKAVLLLGIILAFGMTQTPQASGSAPSVPTPTVASPAAKGYTFKNWQTDDGLPQMTPRAITQTRDGYLWVGTFNGLARFDGVRFTSFTVNNTPELLSDDILSLYEDREGTLWIATGEGGLVRYNNGTFSTVPGPEGSSRMTVHSICEDQNGALWIGASQGLYQVTGGRLVPFTNDVSLAGREIIEVIPGRGDDLWIGTRTDIRRLRQGKGMEPPIDSSRPIHLLAMDAGGQLWASYAAGWLGFIPSGTQTLQTRTDVVFKVDAMHLGREGAFWMGTLDGNLFRVEPGNASRLILEAELPDGIVAIDQDSDDNLWLGLRSGGLWQLRKKQVATLGEEHGLLTGTVSSIREDRHGRIWVGTFGKGLHRWDGQQFEPIEVHKTHNITSLLADGEGTIWFSTFGGQLGRRTEAGVVEFETGFGRRCRTLLLDREGGIWMGTVQNGVEHLFQGRLNHHTTREGLSSDYIRVIVQDRAGDIWIGTSRGLNRIRDGRIEPFFRADGLAGEHVRSLFVDSQGTLWIGSTGGGLTRWHGGRLQSIGTEQGLISDWIEQIIEDDHGYLWLGSNRGLMRINLSELNDCVSGITSFIHCTAFRTADGLPLGHSGTGFQPSSLKTSDGKLWFGTGAGVVVVDPVQIVADSRPPPVYIEEIRADKRVVTIHQGANQPVVLAAGTQRLVFRFTGLDLSSPGLIRFSHKLEGFDSEWVNAGTQREAVYTRVPPGKHRFRVLAANNQGLWNETGATLDFILQPFFWQTGAFQISAAAASLALTGLLVWGFVSRRQKRELETIERRHALERERTRIAQDMHDGLGTSLIKISMLGELAESRLAAPDHAQPQIHRITAMARQAVRDLDEIVWAVNPKNDTVENFAGYLCHFAVEHFNDTPVECHLDIPPELPARTLRAEVRHSLLLAIREALNNILKHAHARRVWIRLESSPSHLAIRIQDEGCGFSGESRPHGNGLHNMAQRLQRIGGRMELKAGPDQGTCVTLEIPMV